MDAAQAITELMQISTQVEAAVALGADGAVVASAPEGSSVVAALAGAALELVAAASEIGSGQEATRVEVELAGGAVFVLSESGRTVAATTGPEPSSGLVVYDLRTCLRSIEDEPKRKRAPRKKKASAGSGDEASSDASDGSEGENA
jgi:predicted regulator of Ras-like GTPase activity (Roadblock/LC7/MglB family)